MVFKKAMHAVTVSTALAAATAFSVPAQAEVKVNWKQAPGAAYDISIGADGTVWVIGTLKVNGGHSIHRWNGKGWDRIAGGALRVDVAPDGNAWVVNNQGHLYQFDGSKFHQVHVPFPVHDVGVGSGGQVWVTGAVKGTNGFKIFRKGGATWVPVKGEAMDIDVAPDGNAWVVNNKHTMFKFDGRRFVMVGNKMKGVSVGANGQVWSSHTTDAKPMKLGSNSWQAVNGKIWRAAVDPAGKAWTLNPQNGSIWADATSSAWTPPASLAEMKAELKNVMAETKRMIPLVYNAEKDYHKATLAYNKAKGNANAKRAMEAMKARWTKGQSYLNELGAKAANLQNAIKLKS